MDLSSRILERPVTSLRKLLFLIVFALILVYCASALADTDYSLSPCPAQLTLKNKRTVITSSDLEKHPELLTAMGMTKDEALADWQARGVVLQAWSELKTRYSCIEVTVAQDDEAKQYVNLVHLEDKSTWSAYEASCKKSETLASLGYTFQTLGSSAKSLQKPNGNHFLLLKYKRSHNGQEYRGYMARTVYQGYSICVDLKCFNQTPPESVTNEITNIMKTFATSESVAAAAAAAAEIPAATENNTPSDSSDSSVSAPESLISISAAPPVETNTNVFTVEGSTVPGTQVIGVLMRIGADEPINFSTTASEKKGTFKMKVTIPEAEENVWLFALNVYSSEDQFLAEKVFPYITYKKTLIPVTFDSPVPESFAGDELLIAGTTVKNVEIQCLATMTGGAYSWNKTVKTNGTGRFTFKIPFSDEGEYNIVLAFAKKGLDTHRETLSVSHILTDEARRIQIRKSSKTAGYSVLVSGIGQFVGQVLRFNNLFITSVDQVGDQWIIVAAGQQVSESKYNQILYFVYEADPGFAAGERHTLYGKCTGMYNMESEETVESYPQFDLLLWD